MVAKGAGKSILEDLLWLMEGYDGAYFEPIVFETSELENDNPFVKEILRTGREILIEGGVRG